DSYVIRSCWRQSGRGGRGLFEYAPALIVVNEWRGSVVPGMDLRGAAIILGDKECSAPLAACGVEKSRGGRAPPRSFSEPRMDRTESGRVRSDDSLLEHEAAVEAPFAGLDDAIGFFREFVEGHSLDRAHRQRAALRSVDLTLHLDLHGRNLVGLADDFHSQSGLVDKGIER